MVQQIGSFSRYLAAISPHLLLGVDVGPRVCKNNNNDASPLPKLSSSLIVFYFNWQDEDGLAVCEWLRPTLVWRESLVQVHLCLRPSCFYLHATKRRQPIGCGTPSIGIVNEVKTTSWHTHERSEFDFLIIAGTFRRINSVLLASRCQLKSLSSRKVPAFLPKTNGFVCPVWNYFTFGIHYEL